MKNAGTSKNILLVEDDYSIRELMTELLEGEGYTVSIAENGRDALDILERGSLPSLIVLDMSMPIMTGREFLDVQTEDLRFQKIPVLVVSAVADEKNTMGATAFIRKPADLNVILAMVDRYAN
jgi:CheY-like chemotaxis protein